MGRLTDRPSMTTTVDRGREIATQLNSTTCKSLLLSWFIVRYIEYSVAANVA